MPTPAEDEPINHLEAARRLSGGLRHTDPNYIHYDLAAFPEAFPHPNSADWTALALILRTPRLLPPAVKAVDLAKALKGVIPSNKNEREVLVRILSHIGVLSPAAYPTFFDGFVPPDDQVLPATRFVDWGYPTIWWRASDGFNRAAVAFWFPDLLPDAI